MSIDQTVEKPFKNIMAGFGENASKARDDAMSRMPYDPQKQPAAYSRLAVGDPTKVEGNQYKVNISYDLAEQTANAPRPETVQARPASFGPTDIFEDTRTG